MTYSDKLLEFNLPKIETMMYSIKQRFVLLIPIKVSIVNLSTNPAFRRRILDTLFYRDG
ncbi:hypothetical protein LEP1GSC188_2514 [Leptospira weilii serovar Topaz str. LT2116]|uniref:Uncharacterized protein n=1 Tax=Leptospira weilii serovar Topaz str. LT2116 TaxID=1088540 RepID=M3GTK4_9LEPT|nr:hypothetical protein LEP1GSC188_2514 [Leptospira weilii serovar Topaz str. LT2116]